MQMVDHAGRPELVVRRERDDVRQLQPDEQEHRVLEQERDGSPVGLLGHPRRRRLQHRRLVPEQQAGHDDREHAAGMDRLGGEVGEEGRDEGQRGVQHRVLDVATHDREHGGDAQPDEKAATDGQREVAQDLPHAHGRGDGHDRGPQRDQGGGVVDQALALEDRDDPSGHAHAARDRGGGNGVRRRDDGTEGQGSRELEPGNQRPGHQADRERREDDRPDGQDADRLVVGAYVDERRADGRGVQQRRQQPDEHDLGIECVVGHTRDQRGEEADDDEDQRRAEAQPLRRAGDDGDRHHQRQDLHCFAHASIMPVTGLTAAVGRAMSATLVVSIMCWRSAGTISCGLSRPRGRLCGSSSRRGQGVSLANSDGVRHSHASVPPQSPHALTPSAPTVQRSPERQPQPQRPVVRQPVSQPVPACTRRPGRRPARPPSWTVSSLLPSPPRRLPCVRSPSSAFPLRSSPRSPRAASSRPSRSRRARCPMRSPDATSSAARRPAPARPWRSACRCWPGSPRVSTTVGPVRRAGSCSCRPVSWPSRSPTRSSPWARRCG